MKIVTIYLRVLWGPTVAIIVGSIAYGAGMSSTMAKVSTVALWMMIWWLENYVRMGITGLLPIVMLPLLAVNPGNKISSIYFSDGMILCIGSLLMANAIESCDLHILAAKIINHYAASKGLSFILFVFIMLTGFLSMWISNTATAALMLPIANAFLKSLKDRYKKKQLVNREEMQKNEEKLLAIGCALDLAIAFAASLGGMATLIGTGSNIVLMGVMKSVFGQENEEITFLGWLVMAGPLSLINLVLLWVLLCACFVWRIPLLYSFVKSSMPDAATSVEEEKEPGNDENEDDNVEEEKDDNRNLYSSVQTAVNPFHSVHDVITEAGIVKHRNRPDKFHGRNGGVRHSENILNNNQKNDNGHSHSSRQTPSNIYSYSSNHIDIEYGQNENNQQSTKHGSNSVNSNSDNFDDIADDTVLVDQDFVLTYKSKVVIGSFVCMALLWITRDPPGQWGWSPLLHVDAYVTDGTVAMATCLVLMIIPTEPLPLTELTSSFCRFLPAWCCCRRQSDHSVHTKVHTNSNASTNKNSSSSSSSSSSMKGRASNSRNRLSKQRHRYEALSTPVSSEADNSSSVHPSSVVIVEDDYTAEEEEKNEDVEERKIGRILNHNTISHDSSFSEIELTNIALFSSSTDELLTTSPSSPVGHDHVNSKNTDNSDNTDNNHASKHKHQHHKEQHTYEAILSWSAVQTLNWDVVFLLGGGFALSQGFEASGLSIWISKLMIEYGPQSLTGFIIVSSCLSCLVTNVMSNVAAANVILPSLVCLGPHYQQSPLVILMPVTLSISLALLFPMGTPPNAIIMTNQRVHSAQLLKVGSMMTVISLVCVLAYCIVLLPSLGHFHHVSENVKNVCGAS